MIEIKSKHPLNALNTFNIEASAKYFCEIQELSDMDELVRRPEFIDEDKLILGGGSNILFTKDFDGIIIHPVIKGIEIIKEDDRHAYARVGSGVEWDDFVAWSVDHNYGGIENLSAIPGNVGASPVQNIGAYGVEVKEVIEHVEGYDLKKHCCKKFEKNECDFDYRNSIFKTDYRNSFLVSHVVFRLNKGPHNLVTHYDTIEKDLMKDTGMRTIERVRDIVIQIRSSKLPDVAEYGNAGSFFKNPVVQASLANSIIGEHPNIPNYFAGDDGTKLSAAWLIDQSGLKGYCSGRAAIHKKHALILINTGGASGKRIHRLAKHVQKTVKDKFGILLEPEVNIY